MNNIPYGHPAWIEINLEQFKQNIYAIKKMIHGKRICLPVKANAYGHGLIQTSEAAVDAGVDYLGVSSLQEGAHLRQAGITIPILVFGAIAEEQITDLINYDLEITLASEYKAQLVAKKCHELNKTCRVHIEIDTGMLRTGVKPKTAIELLNYISSQPCFHLSGVYSHLATSDLPNNEFAKKQIEEFKLFINTHIKPSYPDVICHLANSGGVFYYPESHFDMVRPGILAYGYFPYQPPIQLEDIRPFLSIKAKISYFKIVDAELGVGYGHTYTTKERTRIVTVPVGYGDGYRRSLSNQAPVLIHGKRYQVSGIVCMDQFMVDIGHDKAHVGDEVVLIGSQENEEITLNHIAALCSTIPYEILCGFNDRLPRFYF